MTHMEPVRSADFVLPHQDTRYAWYVAVVLSLCQMVSYIDRWLINLLVGPIKADFQLTDTQMGLLLGLAFTVIHVLLAIPLGRTVDRSNRRNLILICGLMWSMRSEERRVGQVCVSKCRSRWSQYH